MGNATRLCDVRFYEAIQRNDKCEEGIRKYFWTEWDDKVDRQRGRPEIE